jgi:formylglycine-generating enzyme required for sulfatase activity
MGNDLYSKILDLAPGPRPPDHYDLLGLKWFERDAETIHRAGLQRMKALKAWDLHPDAETQAAVQELQNQVGAALATLEDASRRQRYELALAAELGLAAPAPVGADAVPTSVTPVASVPVVAAVPGSRGRDKARLPFRFRVGVCVAALVLLVFATIEGPAWLLFGGRWRRGQVATPGTPPVRSRGAQPGERQGAGAAGATEAASVGRPASPSASAGVPVSGQSWIVPELGLALVWVAPGSFQMGSNDGAPDEKPVHTVRISRGYWLGRTELTQPEYWALSGKKPSRFRGPLHPVESVSWREALGYCALLSAREREAGRLPAGYEYRLPTEAEWEYAARGGAQSRGTLYSGSDAADAVAWSGANSWETACPVGQKQANELGLYDLSGNVWEWCLDSYAADYYVSSPETDPANLLVTPYRAARGGSWDRPSACGRVTVRERGGPASSTESLGFRVCLASALDSGESATELARALLTPAGNAEERPSAPAAAGDADEAPTRLPPVAPGKPPRSRPIEGLHWAVPELGMQFVWVAHGSFRMGSNSGAADEQPEHTVRFGRGFWLGMCEVTQAEYEALSERNPSRFKGPRHPVETVSWNDAVGYCARLTERERLVSRLPAGYEYRLPTEAEWEYAARGGERSRWYIYSGSNRADDVAWHNANSGGMTHPVGQKQPNELGLYDLSGNVWEWCLDGYDEAYYTASPAISPLNLQTSSTRVYRGGSWGIAPRDVRSVYRNRGKPENAISGLGFRVSLAPRLVPAAASGVAPAWPR